MKVFGAICVNSLGEVLLVRGKQSNKWSFPKGHCKNNETDIQCALRELREETGVVLEGSYSSYHKLRGAGYFVFAVDGTPETKIGDHWEIDEISWWPLTCLPRLDSNVDVSIFRTLMKSMRSESNAVEFIDSSEARRKMNTIKGRIQPVTL
jgi:mRNA-decapping enzyme subunit 2